MPRIGPKSSLQTKIHSKWWCLIEVYWNRRQLHFISIGFTLETLVSVFWFSKRVPIFGGIRKDTTPYSIWNAECNHLHQNTRHGGVWVTEKEECYWGRYLDIVNWLLYRRKITKATVRIVYERIQIRSPKSCLSTSQRTIIHGETESNHTGRG